MLQVELRVQPVERFGSLIVTRLPPDVRSKAIEVIIWDTRTAHEA